MRHDLIEKAKQQYKEAKETVRELRATVGKGHPALIDAEVKKNNINATVESYVCFYNMAATNVHAKPFVTEWESKLEQLVK